MDVLFGSMISGAYCGCFVGRHDLGCVQWMFCLAAPSGCGLQDHVDIHRVLHDPPELCELPAVHESQPPLPSKGRSEIGDVRSSLLGCAFCTKACSVI